MATQPAAAELIMRCLNASVTAHILHLRTNSYAAHMALADFYDEVVELADTFAESYQSIYGLIQSYPAGNAYTNGKDYKEGLTVMAEMRSWIRANRKDIGKAEDTELQNIIDEIVALVDSTAYKLRFLK